MVIVIPVVVLIALDATVTTPTAPDPDPVHTPQRRRTGVCPRGLSALAPGVGSGCGGVAAAWSEALLPVTP